MGMFISGDMRVRNEIERQGYARVVNLGCTSLDLRHVATKVLYLIKIET